MKTTEITLTILEPETGMVLRNKNEKLYISKKVALSKYDKIENYEEIEESVALAEKEELEKEIEENLNILVENSIS